MAVNEESAKKDVITIYKDKADKYRWTRVCSENKNIVGASSEGYSNKSDCEDNANRQFISCVINEDL